MKRISSSRRPPPASARPAFAQMEVTCGDYSLMDNAKQMETIAALESETSQMASEQHLTAEAIHEKLAADCEDKVDVMVIEVIKGCVTSATPAGVPAGVDPSRTALQPDPRPEREIERRHSADDGAEHAPRTRRRSPSAAAAASSRAGSGSPPVACGQTTSGATRPGITATGT